jgi:RNA polymerase primary sigma factor
MDAAVTPEQLTKRHWDFAAWHAKRLASRCNVIELEDDLVSAALQGLWEAAQKYDPGRGASFPTFSAIHIRRRVYECIRKMEGTVHRPNNQPARLVAAKARKFRTAFYAKNGRRPTMEEIAEGVGVSTETATWVLESTTQRNIPIETTDVWREGWMVPQNDASAFNETADAEIRRQLRQAVAGALTEFDERTADILQQRHCTDEEPVTLEVLSEKYGISRERIRQIEDRALPRFMRALRRRLRAAA